MAIQCSGIHHLTLTVSNLEKSCEFYNIILGFNVAMELKEMQRLVMSSNNTLLILSLPPDPAQTPTGDAFNENRVGLDHISFQVGDYSAMEQAATLLDEKGISRGEIRDLKPLIGLPIYVMAFRDPDHIQLELTAPHSS